MNKLVSRFFARQPEMDAYRERVHPRVETGRIKVFTLISDYGIKRLTYLNKKIYIIVSQGSKDFSKVKST